MRILVAALLLVGVAQSQIIEGEFFLSLFPQHDSGVFGSMLKRQYNLETIKVWEHKTHKVMWVSGEEADAKRAAELPEVDYMSYNGWAHADQCAVTSHPGVWGLDRTDQREQLPYSTPSDPSAEYEWGMSNGEGVYVYVTDTGIDITHSTFEGRAVWGYTAEGINGEEDGNGHGTHCAGTIGGVDYGLAKMVNLVAVKVLSDAGSGPWSATVDGLTWVQTQHNNNPGQKTVVSMSLGGSGSQQAIEDLIGEMFIDGIVFSISAGNSDGDACNYTPARTPEALTVAATDVTDTTASFTNYGSCVDLHAPGVNVLSAQPGEDEAYFSGTSMSAPHVAGVAARYMSSGTFTSQDVVDWILGKCTADAVTFCCPNHDTSDNLLLYASCSMASPK